MKSLSLLIALSLLPTIVFGQADDTSTSSEVTGALTEDVTPTAEENSATTSETVETTPPPAEETPTATTLESRTQERIINLAANISNRFDSIIGRLDQISLRLRTRAEKQTSLGLDTTATMAALSRAEESLRVAKLEMSTIDAAVVAAIGSTDPVREWRDVRQKYLVARDAIRQSHGELRNAIAALKNSPAITPPETEEPQTN